MVIHRLTSISLLTLLLIATLSPLAIDGKRSTERRGSCVDGKDNVLLIEDVDRLGAGSEKGRIRLRNVRFLTYDEDGKPFCSPDGGGAIHLPGSVKFVSGELDVEEAVQVGTGILLEMTAEHNSYFIGQVCNGGRSENAFVPDEACTYDLCDLIGEDECKRLQRVGRTLLPEVYPDPLQLPAALLPQVDGEWAVSARVRQGSKLIASIALKSPTGMWTLLRVGSDDTAGHKGIKRVVFTRRMSHDAFKPLLANVIGGVRREYKNEAEPELLEANMEPEPLHQFDKWFKNVSEKVDTFVGDSNAVCLSTVSPEGRPSSRMVLLKIYDGEGFTFFTNSISRKGHDLAENRHAAMLFYWPMVHRQIRIEGVVGEASEELADKYWQMRPLGSRIGSKISEQSSVIPSREFLHKKRRELEKIAEREGPATVSRPKTWLAYTLKPDYFEFWQGQPNRVHDRVAYKMRAGGGSGEWEKFRLAP